MRPLRLWRSNVSTRDHSIEVGGTVIEVIRKDIKNLHLGVYPPHGRIRVAVPLRLNDDAVRLAVVSRLGWIRRQRAQFVQQDRQSQREMATGESHYLQGRRYRLNVIEFDGKPSVRLHSNTIIELRVRPRSSRRERERAHPQPLVPGIPEGSADRVSPKVGEAHWGASGPVRHSQDENSLGNM